MQRNVSFCRWPLVVKSASLHCVWIFFLFVYLELPSFGQSGQSMHTKNQIPKIHMVGRYTNESKLQGQVEVCVILQFTFLQHQELQCSTKRRCAGNGSWVAFWTVKNEQNRVEKSSVCKTFAIESDVSICINPHADAFAPHPFWELFRFN